MDRRIGNGGGVRAPVTPIQMILSALMSHSAAPTAGLGRLIEHLRHLTGGYQAPGRERIASFAGRGWAGCRRLSILVAMGFWLKAIIASTVATQTFNLGVQHYDDGEYRTAIRDFDSFVAGNPDDHAHREGTRATGDGERPPVYFDRREVHGRRRWRHRGRCLNRSANVEEFRDVRVDLAELLIKIGEGLADRARLSADAKALAEAESAVPLHAQVAGEPARAFLDRSRLPAKLSEAARRFARRRFARQALAAMDKAICRRRRRRAFTRCVTTWSINMPTWPMTKSLIARMTAANELIRRAVVVDRLIGRPTANLVPTRWGRRRAW